MKLSFLGLLPVLTVGALCSSAGPREPPSSPDSVESVVLREVEKTQKALIRDLNLLQQPTTWNNARQIPGPHYNLRTTRSMLYGTRIQELLEDNLAAFSELLEIDARPAQPIPVWIAPDRETYNSLNTDEDGVSSRWGGYYLSSMQTPTILSYNEPQGWTHLYILHGATQELLQRCRLQRGPDWLRHALPGLMELRPEAHYRFNMVSSDTPSVLDQLRESQWLALPRLLRSPENWSTPQLQQAGFFLEYLAYHHEETGPQADGSWPFAEYLRRVLKTGRAGDSIVADLLENDLEELDEQLRSYEFPATRTRPSDS